MNRKNIEIGDLKLWLDECLEPSPGNFEPHAQLFRSWFWWAFDAGKPRGLRKDFVKALETIGFKTKRKSFARGAVGYRIRAGCRG